MRTELTQYGKIVKEGLRQKDEKCESGKCVEKIPRKNITKKNISQIVFNV